MFEVIPLIEAEIMTLADIAMFNDLTELTAASSGLIAVIGGQFVQTGCEGQPVKHPGWQICLDMLTQINGMRRDFSLSPISRGKLPASGTEKLDDVRRWAEFDTPIRLASAVT